MKFFIMNFISTMMEENNCRQLKVENKLKLIQLQSTILYITKKKDVSLKRTYFTISRKVKVYQECHNHSTTLSHSKRVNSNRCCTRTKPIEYTRSRELDQRAKSDTLQPYTFLYIISRDPRIVVCSRNGDFRYPKKAINHHQVHHYQSTNFFLHTMFFSRSNI